MSSRYVGKANLGSFEKSRTNCSRLLTVFMLSSDCSFIIIQRIWYGSGINLKAYYTHVPLSSQHTELMAANAKLVRFIFFKCYQCDGIPRTLF